jgi:hypothetical protein
MRDPMEPNDDVLFDRLVDGELSADERRQLLATLDDRPEGWRRCALAFVEAQTWQHEFGQLVDDSTRPASVPVAADGEHEVSVRRMVNWYALAASVFIAFTLGLALGDLSHPHLDRAPNPSNQIASAGPERAGHTDAGANPSSPADALTLWVRDETGRARPLRVPLVDATAMDRQLGLQFQSGLPPAVRDQLQQRGFQVESKRRYAPLWLENGRPLVVPVEDTKIVPVSNSVY